MGTRGGAVVRYSFPLDADYEIQIRLARDRNKHVEGLSEAHEVELPLDTERVQLFTVKPPAREAGFSEEYQPAHDNVDQHLKVRVPVKAAHTIGVAFLKKPSALLETARQPYQAHFNVYRHPRGIWNVLDRHNARVRRRAATTKSLSRNRWRNGYLGLRPSAAPPG